MNRKGFVLIAVLVWVAISFSVGVLVGITAKEMKEPSHKAVVGSRCPEDEEYDEAVGGCIRKRL